MNAVVVFSERLGALGEPERRIAAETGAELAVEPLWTEEQLIDAGGRADVLVLGAVEPVTARVIDGLTRTTLLVRRGIGVDNVDVAAATRRGLPVAYVPDASVEEVSDHAVALLLAAERRLVAAADAVRDGDTPAAGVAVGAARRFADLVVGVVGFGRIGQATARKLAPLVARVVAADPYGSPSAAAALGVDLVELDELFAVSHAVTLHAPLIDATRGLVSAERLALLRPGAVVVNTARGELVDEAALVEAVRTGQVAVAALDVTAREPLPAGDPLLKEPGIVLTGHTAAKGRRSGRQLRDEVVRAVLDGLAGRAPRHLADPAVLEQPACALAGDAGGPGDG
ncbi:C-terminal binding protein [Jiangella ureilytica]|uniref:C-terminal binding protein n=1 Tax=Jiangella ureilytica TaxID=2530374 RepID=A0A4R4RMR3_9ACTN|nr:NAD(P)-dependent oxidoreductase [Jiangella ureilytica]TDC50920.1 C-terminal binding protein [Jiangella ureilytica]